VLHIFFSVILNFNRTFSNVVDSRRIRPAIRAAVDCFKLNTSFDLLITGIKNTYQADNLLDFGRRSGVLNMQSTVPGCSSRLGFLCDAPSTADFCYGSSLRSRYIAV